MARQSGKTSWPVYRTDSDGGPGDLPPPIPDGVDRADVQGVADGYGPLLHRCYAVRLTASQARTGRRFPIRHRKTATF